MIHIISGVGAIKVLLLCNFLCTVILLFGGSNLSDQVSYYAANEKILFSYHIQKCTVLLFFLT